MNDNRLYIMKDFTYLMLCKHLHKSALTIASRTARSAYSGLFFRPLGNFSQPLLVFDFTKFMASRSSMRTLPVNSASLMASPFSFPSQRVQYRRDCHNGQSSANNAPAFVRFPVPVISPNDNRYFLSHSCLVRSLKVFANIVKALSSTL